MVKVLHYDGTPITARFITDFIRKHLQADTSTASKTKKQKEVA